MACRIYSTSKGIFMSTRLRRPAASGYSLIELLVVLAIVGILAIAGVTMIGNRQSGAVRGLLDEVEGALSNAHQTAVATGRDVEIVTWGTWDAGTPFRMAHVDGVGPVILPDGTITNQAEFLLDPVHNAAPAPPAVPPAPPGVNLLGSVAVPFRFMPNDTIQSRARIVRLDSGQWTSVLLPTAAGTANESLTTVAPFNLGPMSTGVLTDTADLFPFQGAVNRGVTISGSSKRFNTTFIIPVVGTTSSGGALPGGPMGLIVVLANGGTIYKFYNPGARDSDGRWRRL